MEARLATKKKGFPGCDQMCRLPASRTRLFRCPRWQGGLLSLCHRKMGTSLDVIWYNVQWEAKRGEVFFIAIGISIFIAGLKLAKVNHNLAVFKLRDGLST